MKIYGIEKVSLLTVGPFYCLPFLSLSHDRIHRHYPVMVERSRNCHRAISHGEKIFLSLPVPQGTNGKKIVSQAGKLLLPLSHTDFRVWITFFENKYGRERKRERKAEIITSSAVSGHIRLFSFLSFLPSLLEKMKAQHKNHATTLLIWYQTKEQQQQKKVFFPASLKCHAIEISEVESDICLTLTCGDGTQQVFFMDAAEHNGIFPPLKKEKNLWNCSISKWDEIPIARWVYCLCFLSACAQNKMVVAASFGAVTGANGKP